MIVDSAAAVQFLRTAFEPEDWIAIFLKSYETGRTAQRVGPVATFLEPRIHAWLRAMNAQRFNVYVSVNAVRNGVRTRTKAAIQSIRHLFLEADTDGAAVLAALKARRDLPEPSYVLESSPNRVHVLWRVAGFCPDGIERLQKHLATQLGTDRAATASTQTTRLPGFRNHKRRPSHLVTISYEVTKRLYGPDEFPNPPTAPIENASPSTVGHRGRPVIDRAHAYLSRVEPAIAGEHGDIHTFQVCCRVARGFDLGDDAALAVLSDWNARCSPPWTERELLEKLKRARRYGREPVGALR